MWKHQDAVNWLTDQGLITPKSSHAEVIAAFAANRNRYRKSEQYLGLVGSHAETAAAEKAAAKEARAAERAAAKAAADAAKPAKEAKPAKAAAAPAKATTKATKAPAKAASKASKSESPFD
jgi:hypothetical protein